LPRAAPSPPAPRSERGGPGPHDLLHVELLEGFDGGVDFLFAARYLDGHRIRGGVDGLAVVHLRHGVHVVRFLPTDLYQRELPADRLRLEFGHLDDRHQLAKLLLRLVDAGLGLLDEDGHPGRILILRRADGETFDVELPAAEQRRDLRQHAGLVFDERRQHRLSRLVGHFRLGVDTNSLRVSSARRLHPVVWRGAGHSTSH